MLADLAVIHPEARPSSRAAAEDSTLFWIKDNRSRTPTACASSRPSAPTKALADMREWAYPKKELPEGGRSSRRSRREFETAQSALRYIGWMKDEPSFGEARRAVQAQEGQEARHHEEGLEGAGVAMLGMALRAVGVRRRRTGSRSGATRAPSSRSWSSSRTRPGTRRLARPRARRSPGAPTTRRWSRSPRRRRSSPARRSRRRQSSAPATPRRSSLKPVPARGARARRSARRPTSRCTCAWPSPAPSASSGFDAATEAKLFEKMKDVELRNAAALALILGGTPRRAARTVAMYADFDKGSLDDLKDHYFRAFGYWSDEDFKRGNLYRWVANADGHHPREGERHPAGLGAPEAPGAVRQPQVRQRPALGDARRAPLPPLQRGEDRRRGGEEGRDRHAQVHEGEGRAHGPPSRAGRGRASWRRRPSTR